MNRCLFKIEKFINNLISSQRYLPLQMDITNSCNLDCRHCYHPHHKNTSALGFKDWCQILDQYDVLLERMGYLGKILICGGEPFLSPLLGPLLLEIQMRAKKSNKKNYKIGILTNATLISKISNEMFNLLHQLKDISFQVSLEGATSEAHDIIRGYGSFSKALEGIKILKQQNFKVQIATVLSQRTETSIESLFCLAKELKVDALNFTRLIVTGRATSLVQEEGEDEPLSSTKLFLTYQKIVLKAAEYGIKTDLQKPLYHLIQRGLGRSGRFSESLVVDYQGYILASSRSRFKLGHALKEGLSSVYLKNEIFQKVRKGLIEKCGQCAFIHICGGDRNAAFAHSGDFLGIDPGCWI